MLFRLEFEVVYLNGGKSTVTTRPSTDVAFERKFGITMQSLFTSVPQDREDKAAVMQWFGESIRSEWTYFLAHHASKSTQPFDEWIETVDEINWKFTEEADPTQPVQPAT